MRCSPRAAQPGSDYASVTDTVVDGISYGNVTISAGQTTAEVDVNALPSAATGDRSVTIELAAPGSNGGSQNGYGAWADYAATVTIADDTPELTVSDAVANEGDALTFTARVSHALSSTASVFVPYTLTGGTAVIGTDYTDPNGGMATTGDFEFKAGQTTATLTLPTLLNANNTTGRTFDLVIGPFTGAEIIRGSILGDVTGTIRGHRLDDDFNPDGSGKEASVDEGDYVPIEVKLMSPAAVDGYFSLAYDSTYFEVTSDEAGDDVINPGDSITPSTGGTIVYLWGIASTDGVSTPTITLNYDEAAQMSQSALAETPAITGPSASLEVVAAAVAVVAPTVSVTGPDSISADGDGERTKVTLSATFGGVPSGPSTTGWTVVLPNIPGLEFWTTASGGTPLTAEKPATS